MTRTRRHEFDWGANLPSLQGDNDLLTEAILALSESEAQTLLGLTRNEFYDSLYGTEEES